VETVALMQEHGSRSGLVWPHQSGEPGLFPAPQIEVSNKPLKALRGGISKVNFYEILSTLAINTPKRLQE